MSESNEAEQAMPEKPKRPIMMSLAMIALFGALMGPILIALSGPGYQWGWWPLMLGFSMMGIGAIIAGIGAAGGLGIGIWAFVKEAREPLFAAIPAFIIGSVAAATFFVQSNAVRAAGYPPIHDVTTDFADPPAFSPTIVALREADGARNPPEYLTTIQGERVPPSLAGQSIPELQQAAFPELTTLRLGIAPAEAFEQALAAAEAMGWQIHTRDAEAGRIEATATTFWFGFKDDVVVRIRPGAEGGSVIDARSKSRIGLGDIGANAARLNGFFAAAGWR